MRPDEARRWNESIRFEAAVNRFSGDERALVANAARRLLGAPPPKPPESEAVAPPTAAAKRLYRRRVAELGLVELPASLAGLPTTAAWALAWRVAVLWARRNRPRWPGRRGVHCAAGDHGRCASHTGRYPCTCSCHGPTTVARCVSCRGLIPLGASVCDCGK
jgi:hypothetical protein